MGIFKGGIFGVGGSSGGGGGGSAGVISVEGLSGIIDLDNTNGGLSISTIGQTIILNPLFSAASGALLQDISNRSAVQQVEGLSGIIDLDSPDGSVVITTSGQVINFVVASGITYVKTATFTESDGLSFNVTHNLGVVDFVFNMWRTDFSPIELVMPENVYPIDLNTIRVILGTPMNGKITIIG